MAEKKAKRKALLRAQAVGAYGEKVVEAELLRNGWTPANTNASVKNAADFDIFALKDRRVVQIRVKTCGPDAKRTFQYGFQPGKQITMAQLASSDFTILVSMGVTRDDDEFYIVPTREVRRVLRAHRSNYLAQARRDGGERKDTGHSALRLYEKRSSGDPSYGLENRWRRYRNNWSLLER